MTLLEAALLGVLQGVTEFLPISSSAHLLLARAVFGWTVDPRFALGFDVAVHVGTLMAVVIYFRDDVTALARAAANPGAWAGQEDAGGLLRAIAIGTIPVAVVGLLAADLITGSLRSVEVVAIALASGACVMLVAERIRHGDRDERGLGAWEALLLGTAQASALVPGVSRSGAVLSVAILLGLRRERAARFAFLLGIPAILAAGTREAIALAGAGLPAGGLSAIAIGAASSSIVGYLAIKYFLRYVAGHSLDPFTAYRLALAALLLVRGAGG